MSDEGAPEGPPAPEAAPALEAPPAPEAPHGLGAELRAELLHLRQVLARFTPRALREGTWLHGAVRRTAAKLIERQRRRAVIEPWRLRHPEVAEAALSQRIIQAGARRTAVVGGVAGAAMTAVELGMLGDLGWWTVPAVIGLALAELWVLERYQLNLVFTLAAQYGVPFGHEKLHEVGALYAHVLRIKGASRAAAWSRTGTLALLRIIGLRFASRSAVKVALPVVSMGIGAAMNYLMTVALGRHTLRKFRQRDSASCHLARLLERDPEARRLLVCFMVRMAGADGRVTRSERDLLRRTLEEVAHGAGEQATLEAELCQPEAALVARLRGYDDLEFCGLVLESMALMAVADGHISPAEEAILRRVAEAVGLPLDTEALHARFHVFVVPPGRLRQRFRRAPRHGAPAAARAGASRSTPV